MAFNQKHIWQKRRSADPIFGNNLQKFGLKDS